MSRKTQPRPELLVAIARGTCESWVGLQAEAPFRILQLVDPRSIPRMLKVRQPAVLVVDLKLAGLSPADVVQWNQDHPDVSIVAIARTVSEQVWLLRSGLWDVWLEPDVTRAWSVLRHALERHCWRRRRENHPTPWKREAERTSRRLMRSVDEIETISIGRALAGFERSIAYPPVQPRRKYRIVR